MQDVNVLVVFCSRTEPLALAAALGCVQAKANIRLRWLRRADDDGVGGIPGWKENRRRMEQEYIAPRAVDAEWAHAILIGVHGVGADGSGADGIGAGGIGASGEPPELKEYLGSLNALRSEGKLAAKTETVFLAVPDAQPSSPFESQSWPPATLENARLQGRQVAEAARATKAAHQNSTAV
jgi:hypothetical protein